MTRANGSPREEGAPFVHPEPARALYIHLPFCRARCAFCDFPVVAGRTVHLHGPYVDALLRELELLFSYFPPDPSHPLRTLYVGGGTPSFFARTEWERLAAGIERFLPGGLASLEEWTVEINPEDADPELLRMLRAFGVTRVSIGVQSFDDVLLAALGRVHDAARAVRAVELAADLGFPHVSVDLMYGLPSQTVSAWLHDVERALELPVDHVSAYALGVEPGTRLFGELRRGRISLPEDDAVAEMYERFVERAAAQGFRRYEVSNFARLGGESRHNLAYWRYEPYYAVGLGAHGFLQGIRTANTRHLQTYLRRLVPGSRADLPWAEVRALSRAEAVGEFAFLGFRLAEGVDLSRFRRLFGVSFFDVFAPTLDRLFEAGILTVGGGHVYVRERWVFVQNSFLSEFLLA